MKRLTSTYQLLVVQLTGLDQATAERISGLAADYKGAGGEGVKLIPHRLNGEGLRGYDRGYNVEVRTHEIKSDKKEWIELLALINSIPEGRVLTL
jgi:hypothetical protein